MSTYGVQAGSRTEAGVGKYRVISSDDHVFEPGDLWTSRMEPRFKDRAPRIVRLEDGDWWMVEDFRGPGIGAGAQAGRRFDEPEKLTAADLVENIRPGGYIPEEHIKDMEIDGIDVSIVYPTAGVLIHGIKDGELLSAIFSTYNDWVAEFCQAFPDRLKAVALVNIDDIDEGIREMERSKKMGLIGALIPVYPSEERPYSSPEYEPLWAAAQDLEMPLSLHIGTNRPGQEYEFKIFYNLKPRLSFWANIDHWVRMSFADMIYSGVFERYPKLCVGSIEMELSWVPHFLDRIDYGYTQRPGGIAGYRFKNDMLPSDFFHRNAFVSFQEDALGIRDREIIGVDNLLWGADYPHFESTFPRSQEILAEILADCTEEEKAKIVGGNAIRLYQLN